MHETKMELINQINRVEGKISYFKEQMIGADAYFKNILSLKDKISLEEYTRMHAEAKTALTETNTNLTSEQRMLNILKNKLENNDLTIKQFNTAQKRSFSDD